MGSELTISLPAARLLLLNAQGLLLRPARAARKAEVLAAIRRMGALQIDTIHVVARSPYLTLFSRLGAYEPRWLNELHAAGALFEYWAHAACFLPAEDWPLYRGLMLAAQRERGGYWPFILSWLEQHPETVEMVRRHIRERGPLRSADFERLADQGARPPSGWWSWKDEKVALEHLFYTGELLVPRREKFQRVYDLRERVLPDWDDAQAMPADEARVALLRKASLALGVATEPWLRDYFRLNRAKCWRALQTLLDGGELLPATIEGVKDPAYIHCDSLPLVRRATGGRPSQAAPSSSAAEKKERAATPALPTAELTTLLSPFDPLVWHRARCSALFGFDYRIECYTVAAKRRYGYFTLPLLHRGALIGRLDPKAHRADGVFEVKALHLEPGVKLSASSIAEVAAAIQECADWHGTPQVVVRECDPPSMAVKLTRALGRRPPAGD